MLRCPCSCANINLEENPRNEVVPIHSFFSRLIAVSLRLFVRLRWGFHQKSYNFIQKTIIKLVTISFLKIYFDAKFGHHLWRHNSSHTAKTLSFERYGRKSPGNRPPCEMFFLSLERSYWTLLTVWSCPGYFLPPWISQTNDDNYENIHFHLQLTATRNITVNKLGQSVVGWNLSSKLDSTLRRLIDEF